MIREVPAKEGDIHVCQTSPLPLCMLQVKIKIQVKIFELKFSLPLSPNFYYILCLCGKVTQEQAVTL